MTPSWKKGQLRSSASRAYYAAYQSATAILLYTSQTPPMDREAWSHEGTPELVKMLPRSVLMRSQCNDLTARLEALYEMRLIADYKATKEVSQLELKQSLKNAGFVLRLARIVLL